MFLSAPGQTVIVEAKCVADALLVNQGGPPKLRSAHLYQLLAYLSNMRVPAGGRLTGVLLYAGLGAQRPLDYVLCGHRVLVRNLDLDQPWERIKADLLALSAEFAAA